LGWKKKKYEDSAQIEKKLTFVYNASFHFLFEDRIENVTVKNMECVERKVQVQYVRQKKFFKFTTECKCYARGWTTYLTGNEVPRTFFAPHTERGRKITYNL